MILFKERNFNIAILVSVLWHFLLIISVKPVFKTGHIIEHNTSISFLGSILERVVPGEEKPFIIGYTQKENKIDKPDLGKADFINKHLEKITFLYLPDTSSVLNLNIFRKREATKINLADFFIKGEAKDRLIIYKPDLNKVTILPSDFNSDFNANIKFKISREGFVKYAECVTSSGFPEIDHAEIRYVRKWQFVPNPKDDQEGVVRVSFK